MTNYERFCILIKGIFSEEWVQMETGHAGFVPFFHRNGSEFRFFSGNGGLFPVYIEIQKLKGSF